MSRIAFSRPFFGREEEEAAAAAIRSGWVVGGPNLRRLESRFAELSGAPHGIGVSSWTTGAFLVLKELGIGPGDEVIVPSLTFIASVNVIAHTGATPVFADIDPRTYNIDPEKIPALITKNTRAIMPVDQVGLPCPIDRIMEIAAAHEIPVIEDAACAFASRFGDRPVGAAAPITIFSLHARKVVTTGEGGMIVTHDDAFAERLRRQRHQGMSLSDFERHGGLPTNFETYPEIGYNFRITDIQAAVGNSQLDRLDEMLARRRQVAETYLSGLRDQPFIGLPHVPDTVAHNWQSFQIRLFPGAPLSRNGFMEALHGAGVENRRGVMASHLEPPYRHMKTHLPETERAAAECVQLPMHSGLSTDEASRVCETIRNLLG